MRAIVLSLAAAAGVNPDAVITGSCANTFPALDEQCSGGSHGSFNADSQTTSITDAEQCAGYINTHCNTDGEKAVFFSYSGGAHDNNAGTGICSWWGVDGCSCYGSKNCAKPTNHNGEKVEGVTTGNIKDYLHDEANGVAPVRGDGDVNEAGEMIPDTNLAGGMSDDMLEDAPEAEPAKLSTIPSAGEVAEGAPAKQAEMAEKDGHTESGCPGAEIATNRKEWPCVAMEIGGLDTTGLAGMVLGSFGAGFVAAIGLHLKGKKMRGEKGDPEDGAALSGQDSDA